MRCAIAVYGKVQGVWFRASTKAEADELGLKGRVSNKADGSVYIEVEGKQEDVRKLIDWCKDGPQLARVDKVEVHDLQHQDTFKDFSIYRG